MAETSAEIDAINHLLEVEKNASALINDAAMEAERRLSQARSKYNTEYKNGYDKIASELEAQYNQNQKTIEQKYNDELEAYKATLAAKLQNYDAFASLLEKLLCS